MSQRTRLCELKLALQIKMIILGIDTSTKCGSVALISEEEILGEIKLNLEVTHSERLLLIIDSLLKWSKVTLKDLSGIAVTKGPGSFTGLRIASSIAKGLCYANNIPLLSCSTLEALASNINYSSYKICPVLDAKRNEVYTALFENKGSGLPKRLTKDVAIPLSDFLERIDKDTIFLGNNIYQFIKEIKNKLGKKAHFVLDNKNQISSLNVAYIGLKKYKKGTIEDIETFAPVYLRKSDAELFLKRKNR